MIGHEIPKLEKSDGTELSLETVQAYHRPCNNNFAPDVFVLKTLDEGLAIHDDPLSLDETSDSNCYFYVDADFVVRFVNLVSYPGELPLLFKSEDGHTPQLGCSGTPMLSATTTTSTWKFALVGVVFARCPSSDSKTDFLVCAIPISEDLEQIRSILTTLEKEERSQINAKNSASLNDEAQSLTWQKISELECVSAQQLCQKYAAGSSELIINLPDGLEKLAGSTFASLEQSYLRYLPQINLKLDEVERTFDEFLQFVGKQDKLFIAYGRDTPILNSEYWRLDAKPGTKNQYWLLHVQDNTGKDAKVPGTKKSASSVFAEVKVPVNIRLINGAPLAIDLRKSQDIAAKKVRERNTRFQQSVEEETVSIIVGSSNIEAYCKVPARKETTSVEFDFTKQNNKETTNKRHRS